MNQGFFLKIKNIAVIGLSDNNERPSYQVANYLRSQGFNIIPVNPNLQKWQGLKSYKSILEIPHDVKIDVADFFVKSERVLEIVKDIIKRGNILSIWLQEGVANSEAEKLAQEHGVQVISNMCMMKEHKKI
jgi:predicted CoA-binding protein